MSNHTSHSTTSKRLALLGQVTLTVAFGLLSGCQQARTLGDSVKADAIDQPLVLTDVDFYPETLVAETQPIADYLGDRLQKTGITRGAVKIAPDVETVTQWIGSGEADVYFDSVYPAMLVMEETGATPLLRRWKDGVAEYSAYFVTTEDSDFDELSDLQGEMITLQEPSSSSGFMFPMVYMLDAGMNPVEKAEYNHAVEADEVGYVFSGREDNTVAWILEEKVPAGVIDSETWNELSEKERSQLKIIAETEAFPRHVVLVSATLTPEQVNALEEVMRQMDQSAEGKDALRSFSETAKFDSFPEGVEAEIERLSDAYARLQTHLAETQASNPQSSDSQSNNTQSSDSQSNDSQSNAPPSNAP